MRRELSTYLDLLRLGAAVTVFLSHLSEHRISGGFLWQIQFLGHDSVMVFFVLSGFVISYVAATKEKTLFEYQVARFARLYSVVLPALLLTVVLDRIGIAHNSSSYRLIWNDMPLLRVVASGLFLSQCWSWHLNLLNNDSFWSLPFEFWYYQMFAAAFFFRGIARIGLVAGACLISGPAILIYLPLWLGGVFAFLASQKYPLSPAKAISLFLATAVFILAYVAVESRGGIVRDYSMIWPHAFSPFDYLLAALFAGNIYAASVLSLPLKSMAKPISAGASVTFALYLLHMPILHLVSAFTPASLPVSARGLIIGSLTLLAIIALSFVTEKRKRDWRNFFGGLLGYFMKRVPA